MFHPSNIAARIDAVAYSAVASLPGLDRGRASVAFNHDRLDQIRIAMDAWTGARSVGAAEFARFVDPPASSAAIGQLREAAETARTATTQQDLSHASADLAGAMQAIGLDQWPRFLADAAVRASFAQRFDAATTAAYAKYSHDCSHYLQAYLKALGLTDTPYRTANEFMRFVQGRDSGWMPATPQEAVDLSAAGHIVVAGLAEDRDSGHVVVVGPKMIREP